MTDDELRAIADRCGKHIGQISILATLTALREVRCGKCGGDYSVEHAKYCNTPVESKVIDNTLLKIEQAVAAERERCAKTVCPYCENTELFGVSHFDGFAWYHTGHVREEPVRKCKAGAILKVIELRR